jgi:hypothetical protein
MVGVGGSREVEKLHLRNCNNICMFSLMSSCSMWPLSTRDWGTNVTTALDLWLFGLRLWEFLL